MGGLLASSTQRTVLLRITSRTQYERVAEIALGCECAVQVPSAGKVDDNDVYAPATRTTMTIALMTSILLALLHPRTLLVSEKLGFPH